jgi:hypothetical protein
MIVLDVLNLRKQLKCVRWTEQKENIFHYFEKNEMAVENFTLYLFILG